MNKKITSMLLLILLCISMSSSTYAANNQRISDETGETPIPSATYLRTCNGELISEDSLDQIHQLKDDVSLPEGFVVGQVEALFSVWKLNSIQNLIFGDPYCVWMGGKETVGRDGVFSTAERTQIIDPIVNLFRGSFVLFVLIAILVSSLKLSLTSYSPQSRQEFWQDVHMWVAAALFMAAYPIIIDLLFELNTGFTSAFFNLLDNNKNVDMRGQFVISNLWDGYGIGSLFTQLAEWVLSLYLNIIYVARKIIIMLLLFMSPIAAISLLFAKSRYFLGAYFKELISNIFLPTIHAFVFFGFAMLANMGASTFFKLAMLLMFIPVTGMISRWLNLGDSSTKLGQTATMMGLAGIAGTMMIAKQASSIMRGGGPGGGGGLLQNSNSSTTNAGGDTAIAGGPTSYGGGYDGGKTHISTSASGENSSGWMKAKQHAAKFGAVLGGVGGLPMGPAGAAIGAAIGSKALPAIMQGGRNLSMGIANGVQTIKDFKSAAQGTGGFVKTLKNDLDFRRRFMGTMGESIGSMVGLGTAGKTIGHGLSMVSRQRLFNAESERGGFEGKTLAHLAQEYAGQEVEHRTTRDGSAYYIRGEDNELKRISPMGAGDTRLRAGEPAVTHFKFPDGSPMQLQENGSYRSVRTPIQTTDMSGTQSTYNTGSGQTQVAQVAETTNSTGNIIMSTSPSDYYTIGSTSSILTGNTETPKTLLNQDGRPINEPITTQPIYSESGKPLNEPAKPYTNIYDQSGKSLIEDTKGYQNVASQYGPNVADIVTGNEKKQIPILDHQGSKEPIKPPGNGTSSILTSTGGSHSPIGGQTTTPLVSTKPSTEPMQVNEGNVYQMPVQTETTTPQPTSQGGETVGFSGSTPYLLRTSNTRIESKDRNGNTIYFEDNRFSPKQINPDSYFSHDVHNADMTSTSDRIANRLHITKEKASGVVDNVRNWKQSSEKINEKKHKGIL